MPFSVSAYVDDHIISMSTDTAREAFAKAVEWHVVRKLADVFISDGIRNYSIAEFSLIIADARSVTYKSVTDGEGATTKPRPARRSWTYSEDRELQVSLDAGETASEIAPRLNRTRQAVYARLQRLYRKRMRRAERSKSG